MRLQNLTTSHPSRLPLLPKPRHLSLNLCSDPISAYLLPHNPSSTRSCSNINQITLLCFTLQGLSQSCQKAFEVLCDLPLSSPHTPSVSLIFISYYFPISHSIPALLPAYRAPPSQDPCPCVCSTWNTLPG